MRHVMVWASVLGVTLFTSTAIQAQGNCPGPQDRGKPIGVQFETGLIEVHKTADGLTWSIEAFDNGEVIYQLEVAHGTHLLSYIEVYGGQPDRSTQVTYDYGVPVTELPVPQPSGRWETEVFVTDASGSGAEGQMQAYGAMTDVTIGGCSYDMIPVLIAYETEDLYVEQINYLPDLGIGYLVDSQTVNDPGGPIPATSIWIAE